MCGLKRVLPLLAAVLWAAIPCVGQTQSAASGNADDVQELRTTLASTRSELDECKRQIAELRQQLLAVQQRVGMAAPVSAQPAAGGSQFPTLGDVATQPAPVEASGDQELLAAKVADLEQTKVESASKYKVKLSGMVLLNAYTNVGRVDVTDLPSRAFTHVAGITGGDSGATLRQTILGVQVTGPTLAGARTSADAEMDFYGGIPQAHYGAAMGAARLRTAHARLDWQNWSLVAGQDSPFFSPLSPTSYATVAEPALSWSGNLWTWLPQVRAERRWQTSQDHNLTWTFGVLDPLSEKPPEDPFNRRPDPGEASRMPGMGTHFAWNGTVGGRQATAGFGGYFGKQSWGFNKRINSWLVTGDYNLPFSRWLALSGEIYRGQAIGGLGGGIWVSALFDGDPDVATSHILALNDVGGWSQLKFTPAAKWQFNLAAGAANPLARDLEQFAHPNNYLFTPLARNQTLLINSIYTPRSNLLFALEYRHLRTFGLSGARNSADHVNLSIGVSF